MIFNLDDSPRWTFENLTTRNSYYHGFKFDHTSTDCVLRNVVMLDHGESGVKGTSDPAAGTYPDRVLVEGCTIGFTKPTGGTRSEIGQHDDVHQRTEQSGEALAFIFQRASVQHRENSADDSFGGGALVFTRTSVARNASCPTSRSLKITCPANSALIWQGSIRTSVSPSIARPAVSLCDSSSMGGSAVTPLARAAGPIKSKISRRMICEARPGA